MFMFIICLLQKEYKDFWVQMYIDILYTDKYWKNN